MRANHIPPWGVDRYWFPRCSNTSAKQRCGTKRRNLRSQLVEAQTRQAELQTRLQRLEEDLKPENIDGRLAGIGSTHPEDLREARRRQLETEKRGIQSQLEVLTASRTRLEAVIARADAESYWQSAGSGPAVGQIQPNDATPNAGNKGKPTRKHPLKKRKPLRRS